MEAQIPVLARVSPRPLSSLACPSGAEISETVSVPKWAQISLRLYLRYWESGSKYRFGFNTQEKDDEVYGEGNLYSAKFWEYDSRIGRRWNIDPKETIGESVYSVFGNNPIYYTDIDGDCKTCPDPKYSADFYIEGRTQIDMTNIKPTSTTVTGAPRNAKEFWKEMYKVNKDMFSKDNVDRILGQGSYKNAPIAPVIDDAWVKYNPQDAEFLPKNNSGATTKLIHHHMDQGNRAIALPEKVHQKFSSYYHKLSKLKIIQNSSIATSKIMSGGKIFLKKAGPVVTILVAVSSVANAAPADRPKEVAKQGSGFITGMLGGAGAGIAASYYTANPYAIGAAAIIGGAVGGYAGEEAVDKFFESFNKK